MTAEEFLDKYRDIQSDYDYETTKMMIGFAQMHVEAALKAASNQNNHPDAFFESNIWWIPSDSIINCYPKELIE